MNFSSSPLQARLHIGDDTQVLATHADLNTLQVRLMISLEDSPAWTRGVIVDDKEEVLFEARKVGH